MNNKLSEQTKKEAFELLEKLISIDTVNPPGNEAKVVDYLKQIFEELGCNIKVIPSAENRSNLWVEIDGHSNDEAVMLNGHIDIVPFGEVELWDEHPLKLRLVNHRVVGRGTSDMKGGLAAQIMALKMFLTNGHKPKNKIIFAATCDEEQDGIGAAALVKHYDFSKIKAIYIAEPTDNKISIKAKGTIWVEFNVSGCTAHSSNPKAGVNAVEKAVELVAEIKRLCTDIDSGLTVQITKLHGGVKSNMIPPDAHVALDIRFTSDLKSAKVLSIIESVVDKFLSEEPRLSIEYDIINCRESVGVDADNEYCKLLSEAYEEVNNKPIDSININFFSDASVFAKSHDVVAILFGPGDPEQAHKINESMVLDNYWQSILMYYQLLKKL